MWNVDDGVHILRNKGFKITAQRISILKLLHGRKDHPSAEMIYQELKNDFPTISYATIYGTAQVLADAGLVQILSIDEKKILIDSNPTPHAHFRCSCCGKVEDVFVTSSVFQNLQQGTSSQNTIHSTQIYFHGLCASCSMKAGTA